jgi:hypothetical protein
VNRIEEALVRRGVAPPIAQAISFAYRPSEQPAARYLRELARHLDGTAEEFGGSLDRVCNDPSVHPDDRAKLRAALEGAS